MWRGKTPPQVASRQRTSSLSKASEELPPQKVAGVGRAELPPSALSGSKCQVFKVAEDGSSFRACHQICEGGPVLHPATPTTSPTLRTF